MWYAVRARRACWTVTGTMSMPRVSSKASNAGPFAGFACQSATIHPRFLSPFGDMTLWNILASYVVLPYISPYLCVTNLMLWGHILSVAPETSSMEGGARFHLDTSHHRPGPLVTRCDRTTPRGVRGR